MWVPLVSGSRAPVPSRVLSMRSCRAVPAAPSSRHLTSVFRCREGAELSPQDYGLFGRRISSLHRLAAHIMITTRESFVNSEKDLGRGRWRPV